MRGTGLPEVGSVSWKSPFLFFIANKGPQPPVMLKIHAEGVPPSVSGLQWPKEAQQCPGRDRCSLEKERAREMLLLLGQQRPQPEDSAAGPVQGWLVAFTLRRSPAALAPQRGKGHTGNSWEKCAQKGVQQFLGFKSGQFCPWGLCY